MILFMPLHLEALVALEAVIELPSWELTASPYQKGLKDDFLIKHFRYLKAVCQAFVRENPSPK